MFPLNSNGNGQLINVCQNMLSGYVVLILTRYEKGLYYETGKDAMGQQTKLECQSEALIRHWRIIYNTTVYMCV